MATFNNDLRLKEIVTGAESGTWGTSTNTNLALIADAFSLGTKDMAADADQTFTMPDASADGTRSLYLKITSAVSLTATRTVTLAPNTVSKVWIIENATTGSQIITIAQGSGATVNVPNGSKLMVVTDGAGAGAAVFNANPTEVGGTVTSVAVSGGTTGLTTSGGPITGSGTITLAGTLAVANGGTGITSLGSGVATFLGTPSSANLAAAVTDETGSGALVFATSPTLVTPILGTPQSGTLTNATGLPIVAGTTGTLSVARGGTGATTLTANNVLLGNGTSALQVVAPGATGNVLTSDGTTWASTAPAVTLAGAETLSNKTLTAYRETVVSASVSTSTYNIDMSLANVFKFTLSNSVTFSFTNPPTAGVMGSVTVILIQDGSGNRTATFTSAQYSDGLPPTLSTGAGDKDVLTFFTVDGGSPYYGTFAMADVS
jgi:hypothetical protein